MPQLTDLAPRYEPRLNGWNRMVLDVTIFYSINEINGLTIGLDICGLKLDEVERPFIEQLTAMGWWYVVGDLDNRRGA